MCDGPGKREGRRGERPIGWQVRGGVTRSGSGECAALAAGRGGDRTGPGKRAGRRPRGTREARGTAWGTLDHGSRAARLMLINFDTLTLILMLVLPSILTLKFLLGSHRY